MDVTSATSAVTSTTSKSKEEVSATSGLADDFETFLNLFLVQLQNQDPTDPLDTNQMTDQIVQFTQVEQQINTNTKLDQIYGATNAASLNNALSYVDKYIEYSGDQVNFYGGRSEFAYKTETLAENVKVTIYDASGNVVRSVDGLNGAAGKKNAVVWDGTDNNGQTVPVGQYKFKVEAVNSTGDKVDVETFATDYVTEVDVSGAEIVLHLGNIEIGADKVVSVKASALYETTTAQQNNDTNNNTEEAEDENAA